MAWIVAVLVLAVVTVAILAWVNRRETTPGDDDRVPALKLKAVAPAVFTVAIIAAPLIVWTTSSGDDEKKLMVGRWTSISGVPELLVSLGNEDLNTLEVSGGRKTVRLECRGRQGQTVLDAKPRWPFIKEPGYEYPHLHQAASPEQVQQADHCRLRGTRVILEADVKGALTG